MRRWFRSLLIILAVPIVLTIVIFALLQTTWSQNQIKTALYELAIQHGLKVEVGSIEGVFPFRGTISHVQLQLNDTDSIDADHLQFNLSISSLIKGKIIFNSLKANELIYRFGSYAKDQTKLFENPKLPRLPFHFRSLTIKQLILINPYSLHEIEMKYRVNLKWHQPRRQPLTYWEGTLDSTELNVNFTLTTSEGKPDKTDSSESQMEGTVKATIHSMRPFSPFFTLPFDFPSECKIQFKGPISVIEHFMAGGSPMEGHTDLITGTLLFSIPSSHLAPSSHLSPTSSQLGPYLNKTKDIGRWEKWEKGLLEGGTLSTCFAISADQTVSFSSLSLKTVFLRYKGQLKLSSRLLPKEITGSFLIPSLPISRVKGKVSGEVEYNEQSCHIHISSPQMHVDTVPLSKVDLQIEAFRNKANRWEGKGVIGASELQGEMDIIFEPNQLIQLPHLQITSPNTLLSGYVSINLVNYLESKGAFFFQCLDLSSNPLSAILTKNSLYPLSSPVSGQLGGQITWENLRLNCQTFAKQLKLNGLSISKIYLDLNWVDSWDNLNGKLDLEIEKTLFGDLYVDLFTYSTESVLKEAQECRYLLKASGDWKKPFDIASEGTLAWFAEQLHWHCHNFEGEILDKTVQLNHPFDLKATRNTVDVPDLQLTLGGGLISSSFQWNTHQSLIAINGKHLPLDFLALFSSRFSMEGFSSVDLLVDSSENHLKGHLNLLLERADILQTGGLEPIQTKGSVRINVDQNRMQLHSHLVAAESQFVELSGSLPITYKHHPFHISLSSNEPLTGRCIIEGHVEQLLDFINLGSQRIGGFLSCDLTLNGTLDHPSMIGPIATQNGFYQNYFIGMGIQNLDFQGQAEGNKIVINELKAKDTSHGTFKAKGSLDLVKHLPFHIVGEIDHARVIHFDWLTAACSGPFEIIGDLRKGLVKGTLEVNESELKIPDALPSSIPVLPFTFANHPESVERHEKISRHHYPFHYDLEVIAKENVHLSGRGLEATLIGNLHITGRNLDAIASGTLKTQKGKFSFSGKDFNITEGELIFSESGNFLNISCLAELSGMTITVSFQGQLTSPKLTFQSNPPMTSGDILARILFNKDASELTPLQAFQLANTIVTIGDNGPSVIESIRKNLGIDRLSISTSEETGQLSIQIGKQITKGITITLAQSTEHSHVIIEVELKGGFILQAETQEADQGKFSFKWNKNY